MPEQQYFGPEALPPTRGYSQVVRVGNTVYIAGQVGINVDGSAVSKDDPAAQARQIWHNLEAAVVAEPRSGPIIRTRLTQHFVNPANGWVEGLYVFPLPANAAVDTLKMVIGNRVIIGDVKERIEAKAIYKKAKAEGRKAALVEQLLPNMFTNSVANIGPGETVGLR